MGAGCFNIQQREYNDDNNYQNKINNNPQFVQVQSIYKIIRIQRAVKVYLAKINLANKVKLLSKLLLRDLEDKKLLNTEIIENSKSEKHYQSLLQAEKIKPFSEYIKRNPNIISKLKIISKYTIEIPYYIVTSSKEAYKGSWNLNKNYHGYGIIYQFNNVTGKERRIEGIFTKGILNGYGRIINSDEEMLRGDFAKNKLNGMGEYHRKDGSIYLGSFYEGHPQGNGRETFKDGSFFEGYYVKGKKKHGKYEWKDKNSYQGYFEKDLFHGQGIYKWGDKKMYNGNWKEGKMNGKGKLTFFDGSYYEGEFVDGMKEGKGKYVWKINNYYCGEWKNDKQNGFGIYYKNGKKIKGFWEDGKLKKDINFNSISQIKLKRNFTSDKYKGKKINSENNRLTYTNNMAMITKISGDKKSSNFTGKEDEDENENENKKDGSKISIRDSFGSVYSINSILRKTIKDKQQKNDE